MPSVLIVEDNADKLREISAVVNEVKNAQWLMVETAPDATTAKRRMKEARYDLLILDIHLPKRVDAPAAFEGGLEIARWLKGAGRSYSPKHVLGISAFEEGVEKANKEFQNLIWSIIYFSFSDSSWRHRLKTTVEMLVARETPPFGNNGKYRFDLAILVALDDLELQSVLNLPGNWKQYPVEADDARYFTGTFEEGDRKLSVVLSAATNKGLPFAAAAATKMIYTFWPRYLAMTGICAGVVDRVKVGDVIAADPCWDWGSGKVRKQKGTDIFDPAPYQGRLDDDVRSSLLLLRDDKKALQDIAAKWTGRSRKGKLSLHLAAFASGGSVLQSPNAMKKIKDQHKDLRGVEMEAYAIFVACQSAPNPRPKPLVLKSVSDFGGIDKGNKKVEPDNQAYAAFTSAQAIYELFTRRMSFEPV